MPGLMILPLSFSSFCKTNSHIFRSTDLWRQWLPLFNSSISHYSLVMADSKPNDDNVAIRPVGGQHPTALLSQDTRTPPQHPVALLTQGVRTLTQDPVDQSYF